MPWQCSKKFKDVEQIWLIKLHPQNKAKQQCKIDHEVKDFL